MSEPDYWLSTTVTGLRSRENIGEYVTGLFGLGTSERAENGILWRAEPDEPTGHQRLLIQSAIPPLETEEVETKPVHNWLTRIQEGTRVHYRIHVCPCIRYNQPGRRGDLHLGVQNSYTRWVDKLAPNAGLTLNPDQTRAYRIKPDLPPHYNGKRPQYLPIDQYDGEATITDPKRVHKAVLSGIGLYKGFGYGLLSLKIINAT